MFNISPSASIPKFGLILLSVQGPAVLIEAFRHFYWLIFYLVSVILRRSFTCVGFVVSILL